MLSAMLSTNFHLHQCLLNPFEDSIAQYVCDDNCLILRSLTTLFSVVPGPIPQIQSPDSQNRMFMLAWKAGIFLKSQIQLLAFIPTVVINVSTIITGDTGD